MRKWLALALAAVAAAAIFVGCGETGSGNGQTGSSGTENGAPSNGTDGGTEGGAESGTENKDPQCGTESGTEGETVERKLRKIPKNKYFPVQMEEHIVRYGDISLYGQIYIPDTGDKKNPAVILSHGFNGHYTDFPTECVRFSERGYVVYAFDFCGAQQGGKSTGRSASEYTPFTMKEDLLAVFADISSLDYVDETQVFLFGGSQGGFVTALTAADESICEKVAGVALYFPAFNIPDDWRGKPEQNTPLMGYTIGAEFIRSVQELDPFAVIGAYKKDVCIVWGDQDALVARKYINGAMEVYGDKAELHVLEGAGHGFGGADLNTAVKLVLSFLEGRTYVCE